MKSNRILVTESNYHAVLEKVKRSQLLSVDTETTGLAFYKDLIVGVSAYSPLYDEGWYWPFRHVDLSTKKFHTANLPLPYLAQVADALFKPNDVVCEKQIIGQNFQFDWKFFKEEDLAYPFTWFDTQIAAHHVNENEESFKLENLADKYLGGDDPLPTYSDSERELEDTICKLLKCPRKGCKKYFCYLDPTDTVTYDYPIQDVITAFELYAFYLPVLKGHGLRAMHKNYRFFVNGIASMEYNGLKVNVKRTHEKIEACNKIIDQARKELTELAGEKVNPNSHAKMAKVLKVPTTEATYLEKSRGVAKDSIPGAQALLDFRKAYGAVSRFYRPFLENKDSTDIVHTNLRLVGGWDDGANNGGTVSGRPSSQHPNFLNLPRGTGKPESARDVIESPFDDHVLVELDYGQAELRLAAFYGKVTPLIEAFQKGEDPHALTGELVGVSRQLGKTANFSFLYGIGADSFAYKFHLKLDVARHLLGGWHDAYPGMRQLQNRCKTVAEQNRFIRMFNGRVRHFNTYKAKTKDAANNLIQGSVGCMIEIAVGRMVREMPEFPLVLTIYDSVYLLSPVNRVAECVEKARAIMQPQPWCTVPMVVDAKYGKIWGEMKPFEE